MVIFLLIDDYGHHPKEIQAVMLSIREGWPNRRLVIIFQPHRYTRTKQLFFDFIQVLGCFDYIILLDIYSAGETAIPDISSQRLCNEISENYGNKVVLVSKNRSLNLEDSLLLELNKTLEDGDILLMQGAGDVGKITAKLVTKLHVGENVKT